MNDVKARWLALAAFIPSWLALAWLVSRAQWFWNHRPRLAVWVGGADAFSLPDLGEHGRCARPLGFSGGERRTWPWSGSVLICLFVVQIYQAACGGNAASTAGLGLALMIFIAGNLGYAFGAPGIRHFAFAFGFLLIALPMPSVVHNLVVGGLNAGFVRVLEC